MANQSFWLSVLIPAYEYPRGVIRVLDRIFEANDPGIECIVSDDSKTTAVEQAVLQHPLSQAGRVRFTKNISRLGAVHNWNSLLRNANGEFIILMHHDEFPSRGFFLHLNRMLIRGKVDLVLLRCVLTMNGRIGGRVLLREHVPLWYRKAILAVFPEYLLRRNVNGSPSNVVVRRAVCQMFDVRLRWLVDVEWLLRLFRANGCSYKFSENLIIVSDFSNPNSITREIRHDVDNLKISETRLIRDSIGKSPIFRVLLPISPVDRLLALIESLFWVGFRALTFIGTISFRKI